NLDGLCDSNLAGVIALLEANDRVFGGDLHEGGNLGTGHLRADAIALLEPPAVDKDVGMRPFTSWFGLAHGVLLDFCGLNYTLCIEHYDLVVFNYTPGGQRCQPRQTSVTTCGEFERCVG